VALDAIVAAKRAELAEAVRSRPLVGLFEGLVRSDRDFEEALGAKRTGFLLECKKRSPSGGDLRPVYDPAAIARTYAPFADAVSVLTDGPFFGGSLDDLRRVREAVDLPVLRKDFILDPYQVVEARAHGADAVLLMLSVLDDATWGACFAAARECGMGTLTEVHTGAELERALRLEAPVIGINRRDLRTLRIDPGVFDRLAPRVPAERLLVAESGVRGRADVVALRDRADAFLVGSALMVEEELEDAVRALVVGPVKVCGLTRPGDAHAAWTAGATWGGLVFAADSPRRLTPERARGVRDAAPLRWAGVFVDEDPGTIAALVRDLELHAVQLHGEEGPEVVARLRAMLPAGCEIWKAVRVRDRAPSLSETGADRLLLDAWSEGARGGTGSRFDWNVAASHPERHRVVLAGGLDAGNVVIADAVGVGMLDVSSGVEESPGVKSASRLRAFFGALRGSGRDRR
jgi:indole-3-glycerol phosphate synthase/phosphoribosylanthranilate isomerase